MSSRRLARQNIVTLHMTKTDNPFVISLDFGYVLHYCDAKKFRIYSRDVTKCVHLRGYKTYEIWFD